MEPEAAASWAPASVVDGFLVPTGPILRNSTMLAAAAARGVAGGVRPLSVLAVLVSACYYGFLAALLFAAIFVTIRYYVDNGGSIKLQQRRRACAAAGL